MKTKITIDWHGLFVEAWVEGHNYEGDPDVPGGMHDLGPEIDEWFIEDLDGNDMVDFLNDKAIVDIEKEIMEVME